MQELAITVAFKSANPTIELLRKAVVWKFGFSALKKETLERIMTGAKAK